MKDYPRHLIVTIGAPPAATFRYGDHVRQADLLTVERSLPRILTLLGVTASTSEVRRNRPELVEDIPDSPHFQRITYGKRIVDIFVFPPRTTKRLTHAQTSLSASDKQAKIARY